MLCSAFIFYTEQKQQIHFSIEWDKLEWVGADGGRLEAGVASSPMGNSPWTSQLSIGSCPCTNTALLAAWYVTICLLALPAVGWTCRLAGFVLQIGLEGCGEMGAEPVDVINNITSWRLLFKFYTSWPALNGFRHELHSITDTVHCISGPLCSLSLIIQLYIFRAFSSDQYFIDLFLLLVK